MGWEGTGKPNLGMGWAWVLLWMIWDGFLSRPMGWARVMEKCLVSSRQYCEPVLMKAGPPLRGNWYNIREDENTGAPHPLLKFGFITPNPPIHINQQTIFLQCPKTGETILPSRWFGDFLQHWRPFCFGQLIIVPYLPDHPTKRDPKSWIEREPREYNLVTTTISDFNFEHHFTRGRDTSPSIIVSKLSGTHTQWPYTWRTDDMAVKLRPGQESPGLVSQPQVVC